MGSTMKFLKIGFVASLMLLLSVTLIAQQGQVKRVTTDELKAKQAERVLVVDVRTPGEVAQGMIPGAVNVGFGPDFLKKMSVYPKEAVIVVYCAAGGRATGAALQLIRAGYTNVMVYPGSEQWKRDGGTLVK